jgi:hypothetical protein
MEKEIQTIWKEPGYESSKKTIIEHKTPILENHSKDDHKHLSRNIRILHVLVTQSDIMLTPQKEEKTIIH